MDLTKPSKRTIKAVRKSKYGYLMADYVMPNDRKKPVDSSSGLHTFYVDLLGGYGPTCRLIFCVKKEQEILNRILAVEEMSE